MTWRTRYGRLVATRIEDIDGNGRMEIRVSARLDVDERVARVQAQQLAVRVDEIVREVMGLPAFGSPPVGPQISSRASGYR
ncbi:hypothetical protein [Micromonospora fulviviridis]|uniref:Asp23/Gls24 family envelope stress response protein n=1 Tax=Micromonospora fulviviridis TaxID=47860 RepID=A0ABV2VS39_9ACTN